MWLEIPTSSWFKDKHERTHGAEPFSCLQCDKRSHCLMIWNSIREVMLVKNHFAQSVTCNLHLAVTWKNMKEPTLINSYSVAYNVTWNSNTLVIWNNTKKFMLVRNLLAAYNVTRDSQLLVIWNNMKERMPVKNHSAAQILLHSPHSHNRSLFSPHHLSMAGNQQNVNLTWISTKHVQRIDTQIEAIYVQCGYLSLILLASL